MDDVIVVGAGPAGNNTALGLATRGHAVTVIDWRHDIGDKLCTGLVGRECIRRFPIDPEHVLREPRSAMVMAPGAPGV
ncbi:MAG: NAD(P)/FAD-dependent oxidoreductase, partial [Chloroflexi bacterium]|nr:NAD(P)/FAD-dependent oxidoreductase [Chloroflexota bacterium]